MTPARCRFPTSAAELVLAACILATVGCAQIDYAEYRGEQQEWPTSTGAFVDKCKGVWIFKSLPDRPYTVVGFATVRSDPSVFKSQVAYLAKKHGADGVIVRDQSTEYAGQIQTGGGGIHNFTATSYGQNTLISGYSTDIHTSIPTFNTSGNVILIRLSEAEGHSQQAP